jgi:hypothetical protein
MMHRVPGTQTERYLEHLFAATSDFADEARNAQGATFWCDHTPLNLRVAKVLADRLPDAIFVLLLRHYRGVIQSLRQSYADGYRWAGRQLQDSAALWATYYRNAAELPPERTIALSYEQLCASPETIIYELENALASRFGIDPASFNRRTLATSHATTSARRTIATLEVDTVVLKGVESYDAARWTEGMETAASIYVDEVEALMRERFAGVYSEPLPLAGATT